jgi:hypothetical protein
MVDEDRHKAVDALAERLGDADAWPSDDGWQARRYLVGGGVYHEGWGMGQIERVRTTDYGLHVEVAFESVGRKVVIGGEGNLRIPRLGKPEE